MSAAVSFGTSVLGALLGRKTISATNIGRVGAAARSNTFWTWMLRLLGTLLMYGGVRLVLAPMEVLADVVPLVGKIVRFGNGLVALAVAVPCALTTIAIAWIACRPYVAYPLLALALATLIAVIVLRRKAQRKAAAEAPTAA